MVSVSSCCCGCTLRTGTLIIAWLSLIGSILSLLNSVKQFAQLGDAGATGDLFWPDCSKDESCVSSVRNAVLGINALSVLSNVVSIGLSALLIHAVNKSRPRLMTPYIVYLWISIVEIVVILIGFVVFLAIYAPSLAPILGIFFCLMLALTVYFLVVIKSYQAQMRNAEASSFERMQEEGKGDAMVWKR